MFDLLNSFGCAPALEGWMAIQERGSCFGKFISVRTILPSLAFFLVLFSESSRLSNTSFLLLYFLFIQQTTRIVYIADLNVIMEFLPHFSFLSFFASKYATLFKRSHRRQILFFTHYGRVEGVGIKLMCQKKILLANFLTYCGYDCR